MGLGLFLDELEQGGYGEKIVLYYMKVVHKMQDLGLGTAAAVHHSMDVLGRIFLEDLGHYGGIGPGRGQYELARIQRGAGYGIGQSVSSGVDQLPWDRGVKAFGIGIGQSGCENIVPGRGKAIAAHAPVVPAFVTRLSKGG